MAGMSAKYNDDNQYMIIDARKKYYILGIVVMERYDWRNRAQKVTQVQVNVSFSMAANTQWQDMGHNCKPPSRFQSERLLR